MLNVSIAKLSEYTDLDERIKAVITQDEFAEMQQCEVDEDCVRVEAHCCRCIGTGKITVINRQYECYWNRLLSPNNVCDNVACPMLAYIGPNCEAKSICQHGQCILTVSENMSFGEKYEEK